MEKNYLHILTKYMSKQSHNLNATNIKLLAAKPKKLVAVVTVSNQQTTWLILSLTLTRSYFVRILCLIVINIRNML